MIRNLKALGLALCAVFMLGALSASTASATTDLLTSPNDDTFVTGTQIGGLGGANVFNIKSFNGVQVECEKATYTGTFTGTSAASVEVTPKYEGCFAFGFNATIDDDGCKFVLTGTTHAYTNTSGQAEGEDATVSLNCAHTSQIRITAIFNCVFMFRDTSVANTVNQNRLGVKYDNEQEAGTTRWDVKATFTVDNIHYTTNAACQALGLPATGNDGFLTTNVTVRGYSDSGHMTQTNLTVS